MASPWTGVADEFLNSAKKDATANDLTFLLRTSAKASNSAVIVQRVGDNFAFSGDDAEAFASAWAQLLKAHRAGIAAMTQENKDKYVKNLFVNWGEPVIDIQLVIILFNPVWSHQYDQRQSETVKTWWKIFEEDTGKSAFWKKHSVFLDLVPILDAGYCPKSKDTKDADTEDAIDAHALVNLAAGDKAFTSYVMSRLKSYMRQFKRNHPGKKFQVMLASGFGVSRNKTTAVSDLKSDLQPLMNSIDYYEYPAHPYKMKVEEDNVDAERATFKALNARFAARAAIRDLQYEQSKLFDQMKEQFNKLIKLLTRASLYADCVAAEMELMAASKDNDVKASCVLEVVVFYLKAGQIEEAASTLEDPNIVFPEFFTLEPGKLAKALLKAVKTKEYASLAAKLEADEGDSFNVAAVYGLAQSLVE